MKYSSLIEKSLSIIKEKQVTNSTVFLAYHNMLHTNYVLEMATTIATHTKNIKPEDIEVIQLAAIFHDAIYICGAAQNEKESAAFAEIELNKLGYQAQKIKLVEQLILATKWGHKPQNLLEEIIIDADLAHLHKKSYIHDEFNNLLKEVNIYRAITKENWITECIDFLSQHQYYTEYAQSYFSEGKKQNLDKLKNMTQDTSNLSTQENNLDIKKKKKKKKGGSDRGIETLFRVALRNHTTLSQIADNKANTLISVNAIIISIILSTLFPKFSSNATFVLPATILLGLCLITIVLAIIATLPRTTEGLITKDDILNKKGNLAFFGNFHRMPIEDYEWGIEELMKDSSYLYKSLTRDLYYLGKVLTKKYIYLRIAYFSFVANLIISTALFIFSQH